MGNAGYIYIYIYYRPHSQPGWPKPGKNGPAQEKEAKHRPKPDALVRLAGFGRASGLGV